MVMENPVEVAPKSKKSRHPIFEFKGRRYYRSGYYWHCPSQGRLHRHVWEEAHGDIPNGFHIHHKDDDRSNNNLENLDLLSIPDHHRLHMASDARKRISAENAVTHAVPAAAQWRRDNPEKASAMGRAAIAGMHRKANSVWADYTCDNCEKEFRARPHYNKNRRGKYGPFCCYNCAMAHRRKRKADHIEETCPVCGNQFSKNRYSATQTCSRSCGRRLKSHGVRLQHHG